MEHAAFESPLTDDQLKELGRLVVNCGFAEFLIGIHVGMLFNVPFASRVVLVNNLSLRKKVALLEGGLDDIPGMETRTLVREGCKLVSSAISERNHMLHGIWGYDTSEAHRKPIVANPAKKKGQLGVSDITKNADSLALASRKLKHAMQVDVGKKIEDNAELLIITP